MGRSNTQQQSSSSRGGRRGGRHERFRPRKYAQLGVEEIDYKDMATIRRFLSDRGKIRSRRVTGLSRRHQRQLALAVKRGREIAILPYVDER